MVVEPVAATQRALVEREHGRSLIAYDPNVRLNVEPRLERWRETLAWMLPRTQVLKVSDEDLGLLYPGAEAAALAAQWLAAGVGLVVVTRGGEGAQAWARGVHVRAAPVPVQVVDTVGAGVGETVLIIDEGNSARQIFDLATGPIRAVITGIVDSIDIV